MEFYLVNNTGWKLSESFLSWLLPVIAQQLPTAEKTKLKDKSVGIVLIGRDEMSQLNEQYRGKKGPTDILSFNESEAGDKTVLGELVICVDLVDSQAIEHKLDPMEELSYLIIHGLLHLLGHDHEEESEAKKMFDIQDKVFDVLMDQGIVGR